MNSVEAVAIANKINGWMECPDLEWLFEQSRLIPTGHKIVEVGCWVGRSTSAIMLGHPYVEDVWVVDTFEGSKNPEDAPNFITEIPAIDLFKENLLENAGMVPQIIIGDSAESAELFKDKSISFIFFDADHSEKALIKDITRWMPKMVQNGIVSGHDWQHEIVKKAVRGILGEPQSMGSGFIWAMQIQ